MAITGVVFSRRSNPFVVAFAEDGVEHLLLLLAVVDLLDAGPATSLANEQRLGRGETNSLLHGSNLKLGNIQLLLLPTLTRTNRPIVWPMAHPPQENADWFIQSKWVCSTKWFDLGQIKREGTRIPNVTFTTLSNSCLARLSSFPGHMCGGFDVRCWVRIINCKSNPN